eukprot:PhF_6_TR30570/c0_g1_i1/m.44925
MSIQTSCHSTVAPGDVIRIILTFCPNDVCFQMYLVCRSWYNAESRVLCLADKFYYLPERTSLEILRKKPPYFKTTVEADDPLLPEVHTLLWSIEANSNPSWLSKLTNVRVVVGLRVVTVDGLPHICTKLQGVTYLDLSSTATLNDDGLQHIAQLTNLTTLKLEKCQNISMLTPLSGLTSLTSLDLEHCAKVRPVGMRPLVHLNGTLQELWIDSMAAANNAMLEIVSQLHVLRKLKIPWGPMLTDQGLLEALVKLPQLTVLAMYCPSNETTMSHLLSVLTNLVLLDVSSSFGTALTDAGFRGMQRLTKLKSFHARGSGIGELTLSNLSYLPSLTDLDLSNGSKAITDVGLKTFADHMPYLTTLNLAQCMSITTVGCAAIATLPRLTSLTISGTFDVDGMSHIAQRTTLTSLTLVQVLSLTNNGMKHLISLQNLKQLRLTRVIGVTDAGLRGLGSLQQLAEIDVYFCDGIAGTFVEHLMHSNRLGILRCSGITYLSTQHFHHKLSSLHTLNLSFTDNLNKSLFERISCLPCLSRLDLRGSKMIGDEELMALIPLGRSLLELSIEGPITNAGFEHLSHFTSLRELFVLNCLITNNGLQYLADLPSLYLLDVSNSSVSDEGLTYIIANGFHRLAVLVLSGCNTTPAGKAALQAKRPWLLI